MRFDVDRLSKLAGVPSEGRRTLREASNRSYHDKDANDTADERFGKNQLSELGNGKQQGREPLKAYEAEDFETDKGDKTVDDEDAFRGMKKGEKKGKNEGADEDVVLEIDEGMLRREIIKMKRERLEETRLRGAIRNEIRDIFASLTSDSSWVYGNKKPRKSKKGSVHMGFPGIGFM